MADQSTFLELDSFTEKMLRNIDIRRRKLNALCNDDSTIGAFETKPSITPETSRPPTGAASPPTSPVPSEGSCEENDTFHVLSDGPEVKAQMRRSISALLNIQKEIFPEDQDDDDESGENGKHLEKVKERFKQVVSLVSAEEKTNVLTESTNFTVNETAEETAVPKPSFKERMSVLARGYYPSQEQEFVKPKPVQSTVPAVVVKPASVAIEPKENSKVKELQNIFHSQVQAAAEKPAEKEKPVVLGKKSSVSNLKNMFEQKIQDLDKPKHELAPELLSIRDKKRLFEKAIREETAASKKAQEMFQKPKKRIVDWQPTGNDEATDKEPKRKKSIDSTIDAQPQPSTSEEESVPVDQVENVPAEQVERVPADQPNRTSLTVCEMSLEQNEDGNAEPDNEEDYEDEQESVLTHSRIIEDTVTLAHDDDDDDEEQRMAESCQIIDEAFDGIEEAQSQHKDPVEETMDITFSALDDGNLQRSSTKVNLSSEELPENPSKPPRAYLYNEDSLVSGEPQPQQPHEQHEEAPAEETPVLRTISFYRREQKLKKENAQSPGGSLDSPVRFLKQNILPTNVETQSKFHGKIVAKIEALKDEIKEHNRVSSQASTALNMCLSYSDPTGFEEARIEAERLLLVSAEKRSACLNQIQRYQSVLRHPDKYYPVYCETASRASINISNIKIPFKNDFLVSRAKGNTASNTAYFMCLIVCNGIVHVSELLSANDDVGKDFLNFKFLANFADLTEDFQITLKLFCLELNNDSKARERNKTFRVKFGTLLKSSFKKSPTSAVPSSSFKSVGRISLNLPSLKENKSTLYRMNLDTLSTPVDGYITMTVRMDVHHRTFAEGYFDIQEKATSFWNLRYFVLSGEQLKFWRFKDDMKDKRPFGVIDLRHCLNPKLSLLQGTEREVCMRPNTFVLFTIVPPEVSNTEKLLKGGVIRKVEPERFLISSASKEDSVLFCAQLNQVLRNIRTWSNDCVRPYSVDEFNRLLQSKQ